MNKIAKFEKVSYEQFKKDWVDTFSSRFNELDEDVIDDMVHKIYEFIKLPKRATTGSAGYDFFLPYGVIIPANESVKIPTGIKCNIEQNWVLQLYPRSGHGFKFGVHLANTVGVVDSDYYHADNEGHIFVKLVNDSSLAKPIHIKGGDAFCQGIFLPFGVTVDDDASGVRHGGFGSTSR